MKFFLPALSDSHTAENIYEATKKFAESELGCKIIDRRIFSIRSTHNGKEQYDEVGKENLSIGEIVIAILEADSMFLVCTKSRGVRQGIPMLVGKDTIITIVEFDS